MLEADDVVVVKRSMDLDLRHELLLGTSLGERGLRDDLGCRNSLVFQVRELKASGKASLSEEFALEVALDADFSVVLDDFLFDNGLGIFHAFLGIIAWLSRVLCHGLKCDWAILFRKLTLFSC